MQIFHAGLSHFLFVSVLLFGAGLYAVVTRKNMAMKLIGMEFILSAAALNFTVFQKFTQVSSDGQAVSMFIIILAVTQSVVFAGIILNFYRHFYSINADKPDNKKE
jgi:NADH-quinone oxidoreductase subunit K